MKLSENFCNALSVEVCFAFGVFVLFCFSFWFGFVGLNQKIDCANMYNVKTIFSKGVIFLLHILIYKCVFLLIILM